MVVLDLSLPGIDGLQVIQGLRGWTRTPIIVLSVREREADKVAALDAGADDYVTKPFGINELQARLRAAIRRANLTRAGRPDHPDPGLPRRPGRQADHPKRQGDPPDPYRVAAR